MATLQVRKVNSLPGTLTADTLYMVKNGNSINLYISDSTGAVALPVQGPDDALDPFLLMGVTGDN